jgi:hypothetical protein
VELPKLVQWPNPMKTEAITIQVTPKAAMAYRSASEEDRRKLDLLISLQLTEDLKSGWSLEKVMDDMSQEAAAGLTPEMLNSSLFDFLSRYIGTVEGTGETMSENCGERFATGLSAKRDQGHL